MYEVVKIPVSKIALSDANPRRSTDDSKIDELSASIRQHGVLQPIMVKSLEDDTYEVIVGSRRVKAASKIDPEYEIPCQVPDNLTEEDIEEIRIIENLQREDISPFDEAEAYCKLSEASTVDTIAERIGKSKSYVIQRMRLTLLIQPFVDLLQDGDLHLSQAIEISKYSQDDQQIIYDLLYKTYNGVNFPTLNKLKERIESIFHLDLNKALWDLADQDLYPEAGACSNCHKNTACQKSLFPEYEEEQHCTDNNCFETKKSLHLKRTIDNVIENEPDVILFNSNTYSRSSSEIMEAIKDKGGHISDSSEYEILHPPVKPIEPDKPTLEDVKEWYDCESEEDYNQRLEAELEEYEGELNIYKEDLIEYEEELKEYQKASSSDAVRKGVNVNAWDQSEIGREILLVPNNKVDASENPQSSNENSKGHIISKISDLRQKDQRNLEIAFEKTYDDAIKATHIDHYKSKTDPLTIEEKVAMFILLSKHIAWRDKDVFDLNKDKDNKYRLIQKIETMSPEDQNKFVRHAIWNGLTGHSLGLYANSDHFSYAKTLMRIVKESEPEIIKAAEEPHVETYSKRKVNILKKIEELQAQLDEEE